MLRGLTLSLATLAVACGPTTLDPTGAPSAKGPPASGESRVHYMPVRDPNAIRRDSAPSNAQLTYYGGPVIAHVKVVPVYWGSSVQFQPQLDHFYAAIVASPYMDWLGEYDTSSQSIGRGSFAGSYVDGAAPSGSSVDDTQIQAELSRLITAGHVPAPDADTLYMLHFPPGVTVTHGSEASCSVFCAYHGTYVRNGGDVYYGVVPDMGGACAQGCGTSTHFNDTTSAASHEMIEAVTDAAVGLATGYGAPLAWYDASNGEIGDLCENGTDIDGTVGGWTVQKEWSNAAHGCIVSAATSTTTSDFSVAVGPASATVAAGASVSFTVGTKVTAGSAESLALAVAGLPAGVSGAFSPATVTAGASSTLTLTAASSAASSTATFTVTATGASGSHAATASVAVQAQSAPPPPPPPSSVVANGGFEAGNLSGWTLDGGVVDVVATQAHAGTYAARVGSTSGFGGDSAIEQRITVPSTGTSTLSYATWSSCADSFQYDQQQGGVFDASGNLLATLFDTCDNAQAWKTGALDLTPWAGQQVVLYFNTHDDGYAGDPTYFYLDDVAVTSQ